jgi:hypothetical protein
MAQASIAQQERGWTYTPLTTKRRCHDEAYWLSLELRREERLSKDEAERRAIRMVSDLRTYADDWDWWAYQQGNDAGMPF